MEVDDSGVLSIFNRLRNHFLDSPYHKLTKLSNRTYPNCYQIVTFVIVIKLLYLTNQGYCAMHRNVCKKKFVQIWNNVI
jgi:hypothetical protein